MEIEIILSLAAFLSILGFLIFLRSKNKELAVTPSDILISIIPVLIYLFVSGQIKSITVGDFHVEAAFMKATETKVTRSITELPIEKIPLGNKQNISQLDSLIKRQIVGLKFKLGYPNYDAIQVEEYLEKLTQFTFFKYIIVIKTDETFVSMADAHDFYSTIKKDRASSLARSFVRALKDSDMDFFKQLPFISDSIEPNVKKSDALKLMQELRVKSLPVTEENKVFGVVTQENLATSLVLDVAEQLREK